MTRSVNRALDVLEALRDATRPLTLSELASRTNMDKATTMRIARDLLERRYVEQDPDTRRYSMGWSVLELAGRLWSNDSMTQIALRHLEDLRDKTLQTVALCARSGDRYVINLELPSLQPIKFTQGVGASRPLGDDAPGLVILAFAAGAAGDDEKPDELDDMAVIREQGYCYSVAAGSPRTATVAAPVLRADGSADAAVLLTWALSGDDPADETSRRRFSAQVRGCAQRISGLRRGSGR
ncbi:helix-turn-helix domain-containing protein [Phytohabitans sp. ZYX-F-186]|uniref:Helix-turn-helix domain-containing protein n=1 Tax=Phytohabitans maris TaxID=3071409 RepID=A0ABU0ZZ38_9ACTN|nr:helix-turn-helix domain-containing protein [Phytohabitans sp. ZYX-F-186]MDQ7911227.1 helix-turn-helix domain-containing protein [Phytohabitans sp. ZYX-F-186]